MPNHRILFASIVAAGTIAVAPLADEAISPPAARAVAAAPLDIQPITAPAAGTHTQQGAEGSLAPASPSLRSRLWSDPTARGGLDFDRHPFLSTFVLLGTVLAGLLITSRIRRGQDDDGPKHVQPEVADSAVVATGIAVVATETAVATKVPPRPETDPS